MLRPARENELPEGKRVMIAFHDRTIFGSVQSAKFENGNWTIELKPECTLGARTYCQRLFGGIVQVYGIC